MLNLKSILLASVMVISLLGIPSAAHAAPKLYCPGQYCKQVQRELAYCADHYHNVKSPGPIDGIYGPKTKASIISFQKVVQITPDGLVGPVTWRWLIKISACHRDGKPLASGQ